LQLKLFVLLFVITVGDLRLSLLVALRAAVVAVVASVVAVAVVISVAVASAVAVAVAIAVVSAFAAAPEIERGFSLASKATAQGASTLPKRQNIAVVCSRSTQTLSTPKPP
jgi:hypothetical protein